MSNSKYSIFQQVRLLLDLASALSIPFPLSKCAEYYRINGSTILSITPGCTSAAICAIMLAVSPSMIHVLCSRTGNQKVALLLGPGCSGLLLRLAFCRLAACACRALLPVLRPRPAAAGYRPIRPVCLVAVSGPTYAEGDHGWSPSVFYCVPGQPCSRRGPPARDTTENRKLTHRLGAWGGGG